MDYMAGLRMYSTYFTTPHPILCIDIPLAWRRSWVNTLFEGGWIAGKPVNGTCHNSTQSRWRLHLIDVRAREVVVIASN
jgi:hypothetical protein